MGEKIKEKMSTKKKAVIIISDLLVFAFLIQCIMGVLAYNLALTFSGKGFFDERKKGSEATQKLLAENDKWLEENAEVVTIKSEDGLTLSAYKVTYNDVSNTYAVLCHPYNSDSAYMVEYAKHYYDLGMNVLLVDSRCHGKSEGKYYGMGYLEKNDLVKWIAYITKNDAEARIMLHGLGMGGSIVAMTAGEDLPDNVRFIINDGGYSDLKTEIKYLISDKFSLLYFPIGNIVNALFKSNVGADTENVSAAKAVEETEIPMLFIHPEDDETVPLIQGNKAFDSCGSEAYQYIANGAVHLGALSIDSEAYWNKVDTYLLKYIGL